MSSVWELVLLLSHLGSRVRESEKGHVGFCNVGYVWLEEWNSGRIENCERMEKWEDEKYLVFFCVCLVGGMEKWENEKLFCLIEKKSGMVEKVVYINW